MRQFRSEGRDRFRGRAGGSRFSGRGNRNRIWEGGRGRDSFGDSERRQRRPLEMHEVTCDKCGKQCEVPFKPTEGKPVFCSDCFQKNDNSGGNSDSTGSFSSRNQDRRFPTGMSSEQFKQINAKLDKILQVLQDLEIVPDEDSEDEEAEEESK